MALKREACVGGKHSKLRLTVLLCCNMSGNHKLRPLVIGKSKNPRCFKNARSLPCPYESSKRAWITRDLFAKWVVEFNRTMASNGRRVALLVDNCSAHMVNLQLSNVKLEFMPAKCTSVLQPLDQRIIRNFKRQYQKFLLQERLLMIDSERHETIDVRKAIGMIAQAWREISKYTIEHCWQHPGIRNTVTENETNNQERV